MRVYLESSIAAGDLRSGMPNAPTSTFIYWWRVLPVGSSLWGYGSWFRELWDSLAALVFLSVDDIIIQCLLNDVKYFIYILLNIFNFFIDFIKQIIYNNIRR